MYHVLQQLFQFIQRTGICLLVCISKKVPEAQFVQLIDARLCRQLIGMKLTCTLEYSA